MSVPKRHHWWPQLQSGYWTGADGFINVTRHDGSTFKAPPSKIGVEGELYTRYDVTGAKDVTIERWFSEEIESPFVAAIKRLSDCDDIISSPLPTRNLAKEMEIKELGFIVPKSVEKLRLSANDRAAINGYLAALLGRVDKRLQP